MQPLELFGYIFLGILAQVAVLSALAIARHMKYHEFLQRFFLGLGVKPAEEPVLDTIKDISGFSENGSWQGLRDFRVSKKAFEDKDKNICSFYLSPVDGKPLADFKPGQFLTFQLDGAVKDGDAPLVRCYSLSGGPGGDSYRVSIKRVPPPADRFELPPGLSSNYFHDHVQKGDVLKVRAPSGHFFLERGSSPVVLIAGGIGITPMLSMLVDTLNSNSKREVWLFYGVRNSSEHAMKSHIEELAKGHDNFHLRVCYSAPKDWDKKGVDYQHKGRVDIELLRLSLPFQVYDFYICGPRPMLESIVPALEDWGVPDERINYEAFGPASINRRSRKQTSSGEEFTITFAKSGVSALWDGSEDTLLDFAESNGVIIPSGCRAGGCGSCQTEIIEGEVSYNQTPDFDPDEGSCLLCVSRPKKNLVVEA